MPPKISRYTVLLMLVTERNNLKVTGLAYHGKLGCLNGVTFSSSWFALFCSLSGNKSAHIIVNNIILLLRNF